MPRPENPVKEMPRTRVTLREPVEEEVAEKVIGWPVETVLLVTGWLVYPRAWLPDKSRMAAWVAAGTIVPANDPVDAPDPENVTAWEVVVLLVTD
jgi:hypothetical protein